MQKRRSGGVRERERLHQRERKKIVLAQLREPASRRARVLLYTITTRCRRLWCNPAVVPRTCSAYRIVIFSHLPRWSSSLPPSSLSLSLSPLQFLSSRPRARGLDERRYFICKVESAAQVVPSLSFPSFSLILCAQEFWETRGKKRVERAREKKLDERAGIWGDGMNYLWNWSAPLRRGFSLSLARVLHPCALQGGTNSRSV